MQNIGNFSRLCNKKSARCVFALIFARLLQLTTGDIVFRDDEQSYSLGDNCQFTNGSSGMCFHASACPEAATDWHTLGTPVITCSFIKKEPLVCCFGTRRSSSDLVLSSDRMSQLDDNHETTTVPMQHATDQRISDYLCKSKYLRPPNRNDFVVRTSIVGGNRTETGEFPHMAALGWHNNATIDWRCGGTLISDNFVVTAAHCTSSETAKPNVVRIGDQNLLTASPSTTFEIERIVNHPQYHPPAYYNDIALVQLRDKVEFSDLLHPACLWQSTEPDEFGVIATGYGATKFGGPSQLYLLKVQLSQVAETECSNSYDTDTSLPFGIQSAVQLCAGDAERQHDTCQGDSSGPLQRHELTQRGKGYYLIGITSFGKGCATAAPAIYTRVAAYVQWIESIVWPIDKHAQADDTHRANI